MNKIWRRQFLTTLNDVTSNPESDFLDLISNVIKNLKRKEELLIKIVEDSLLEVMDRPQTLKTIDKIELTIKFQNILDDQKEILKNIQEFKQESYYKTKAYVYTILVRINQICEASRQKYQILKSTVWINSYKNIKQEIMDQYNNLMHKQQYDMSIIIKKFVKFQNESISKLVPRRLNRSVSPLKINLQPIGKTINYQRVRSAQSQISLKPAYSLQIPKQKILKRINNSHMKINQKLQKNKPIIAKRLKSTKKSILKAQKQPDNFQKIYTKNFHRLYKVLDVKQLQVEESFYFRMEMQRDLRTRNQKIKVSVKEWESNHENYRIKRNVPMKDSRNDQQY